MALALPALAAEEVRGDLRGLVGVIRRVRDPDGGCPWDLAQDHQSLRPHLLEETYEVLEAIDGLARGGGGAEAWAALREELGDLLMQIVLHARLAEQGGRFTLGDVAEGIRAKLVRRHPHVFGEAAASTPAEVERNWDQLKAAETKPGGARRESALDGAPSALPALARAQQLTGRAGRRGFAWESDGDVLAKLAEELAEVAAAPAPERAGEVGDLLFVVCDYLRRQGVEAEDALREACGKFERRFRALEASLRAEGLAMESAGQVALLRRWEEVKAEEGEPGCAGVPPGRGGRPRRHGIARDQRRSASIENADRETRTIRDACELARTCAHIHENGRSARGWPPPPRPRHSSGASSSRE